MIAGCLLFIASSILNQEQSGNEGNPWLFSTTLTEMRSSSPFSSVMWRRRQNTSPSLPGTFSCRSIWQQLRHLNLNDLDPWIRDQRMDHMLWFDPVSWRSSSMRIFANRSNTLEVFEHSFRFSQVSPHPSSSHYISLEWKSRPWTTSVTAVPISHCLLLLMIDAILQNKKWTRIKIRVSIIEGIGMRMSEIITSGIHWEGWGTDNRIFPPPRHSYAAGSWKQSSSHPDSSMACSRV